MMENNEQNTFNEQQNVNNELVNNTNEPINTVSDENFVNEQNVIAPEPAEDRTPIMENINVENITEPTGNVAPIAPVEPVVEKKKKGKGLVIVLILLLLIILGGAGYMYYRSLDNTNKEPNVNDEENNANNNENNNNYADDTTIVATYTEEQYATIHPYYVPIVDKNPVQMTEKEKELLNDVYELAKTNPNIDTRYVRLIDYNLSYESLALGDSQTYKDFSKINYQLFSFKLEDGKLYLYSNSTANNLKNVTQGEIKEYKSEISNITDEVILIKEIQTGGCTYDLQEIAVLTKTGDLFVINLELNRANLENIIDSLSQNIPVAINYRKINDDVKVKAFTFYEEDNRTSTCNYIPNPLLASDNTYRNYEFKVLEKNIIRGDNFGDAVIVYEDYTAAVKAYDYLINKDGETLKVKATYGLYQDILNNSEPVAGLIKDENDYLYYVDGKYHEINSNEAVKLYKDVKVKSTTIKETEKQRRILEFTFEDGSNLVIDNMSTLKLYR